MKPKAPKNVYTFDVTLCGALSIEAANPREARIKLVELIEQAACRIHALDDHGYPNAEPDIVGDVALLDEPVLVERVGDETIPETLPQHFTMEVRHVG